MPHRDSISRVITRAPLLGVITTIVVVAMLGSDATAWRLTALGGMVAIILALQWRDVRGGGASWAEVAGVVIVCQLIIVVVTGGVSSPLLVMTVPFGVLSGMAVGERSLPAVAAQAAVPWLLLLFELSPLQPAGFVPESLGGERPIAGLILWCAVITMALVGGNATTRAGRRALDADRERALAAERATSEALAQRSADLVALSGAIAHELKNPLTATLSLASFQHRRAPEGSPEREQLGVMLAEMRRMRETLGEFLTLSKPLDALALGPLHLDALAAEVLGAQAALAQEAQVTLEGPEGAAQVMGHPRKLAQVLENLLQNAIQACALGGRVGVVLREVDEQVIVEVWDEGRGLPDVPQARLFEPGYTTRSEGTGLGLSVCRVIAEQHGGSLRLSPRAGGGSVATLTLKRATP